MPVGRLLFIEAVCLAVYRQGPGVKTWGWVKVDNGAPLNSASAVVSRDPNFGIGSIKSNSHNQHTQ